MPTSTSEQAQLAERARVSIQNSGLVQREVARHIGLDETKLSKSLAGTRRFRPSELTDLADVTGVTVNWLMSGSDQTQGVSAPPPSRILPTRHPENSDQAQKRRKIIESAWWLLARRGYSSVRIADIAHACGVSTASVHYYFSTKREIFAEVLRYSVKLAFDRQIAELHAITEPVSRLKRLIELQLPAGERGRAEWSIWLQTWAYVAVDDCGKENHAQGYRRWIQTVEDAIVFGQQAGVFAEVPAADLAIELTSLVDGLGIKVLTGMLTSDQMHDHIESFIDRNIVRAQGSTQ
ncbi:TetR/AcrR family transcriptional regulator [Arthrobacter sp. ISL-72]|uniref:TetR/AcrR family transcriptional regulator n=1 Tax=Arthrobacter sp. ISL-72 TaxID=2819114 RepID=UPI001BE9DCAF|nr:TetR/AcrR family transcriptional regulator [Arthrobacter sp. ISL-72]MBT2597676.1 TetR family transcriptional regulator C-terminal domain-containing protein [Arthrobacter sp. ISL-72]